MTRQRHKGTTCSCCCIVKRPDGHRTYLNMKDILDSATRRAFIWRCGHRVGGDLTRQATGAWCQWET